MYVLPIILAVCITASNAGQVTNVLEQPIGVLSSELLAVKDPVDETITTVLSSQCDTVKQLLRQDYGDTAPDLSKLTLVLHTRATTIIYNLTDAAELIPSSEWFKAQKRIIIYMHGFIDNPRTGIFNIISEAFLKEDDCNVLALDASSLLGLSTLYIGATTNVRYIGERLGAVLANMIKVGATPSSIYLIGHSLGAHIAGFTGKSLTALTGERVARVTGLDPAAPCFTEIPEDLKLKAGDGVFVDVIHTDAGVLGIDQQLGDVDYYPNSGSLQPNCFFQTCSHSRAWSLFAESVLFPQSMPAVSCDSWADFKKGQCNYSDVSLMGYASNSTARGRYYLQTAGTAPYGLGDEGIRYVNKDGLIRNTGSAIGIVS